MGLFLVLLSAIIALTHAVYVTPYGSELRKDPYLGKCPGLSCKLKQVQVVFRYSFSTVAVTWT